MYYCKWCDAEFKDAKTLRKHEGKCEFSPSMEREKKFICDYCHTSFPNKDTLKKHISICSHNPTKYNYLETED